MKHCIWCQGPSGVLLESKAVSIVAVITIIAAVIIVVVVTVVVIFVIISSVLLKDFAEG